MDMHRVGTGRSTYRSESRGIGIWRLFLMQILTSMCLFVSLFVEGGACGHSLTHSWHSMSIFFFCCC